MGVPAPWPPLTEGCLLCLFCGVSATFPGSVETPLQKGSAGSGPTWPVTDFPPELTAHTWDPGI